MVVLSQCHSPKKSRESQLLQATPRNRGIWILTTIGHCPFKKGLIKAFFLLVAVWHPVISHLNLLLTTLVPGNHLKLIVQKVIFWVHPQLLTDFPQCLLANTWENGNRFFLSKTPHHRGNPHPELHSNTPIDLDVSLGHCHFGKWSQWKTGSFTLKNWRPML